MEVRKSDGSLQEFNSDKIRACVKHAYESCKEECSDLILSNIVDNLYIYDGILTSEINRQVSEALMSINKKVAKAFLDKSGDRKILKKNDDFVRNYIAASNAATGSKYDSNANVSNKNIVTLGSEIHKGENIQQNRYIMHSKIKSLYSKKLADQYIYDLEHHIIYRHDESGTPGFPYTYSAKEVVEVLYNGENLLVPLDLLYDLVNSDEALVDPENVVYQKKPWYLFVKDQNNTYTRVTHITKKKRHKDLVRVKTAFGEDLVVTEDHPMIVNKDDVEDTIPAAESLGKNQYKIDTSIKFKGKTEIDLVKVLPSWVEYGDKYIITPGGGNMKRFIELNRDFGYVVGFFIGDGGYLNTFHYLSMCQKEKAPLEDINNKMFDIFGITAKINSVKDQHSDVPGATKYEYTIRNHYIFELFKNYFKIQDKAQNKTLPINLLEFNEEFAKGILEGLIDSDGTIKKDDCSINIRLSSRAGILQCTELFRYFNYSIGNTMQSLPFSNNSSYKTNYTIWGINATKRPDSVSLDKSFKVASNLVNSKSSSLKYHKDGTCTITSVDRIEEESSFLLQNEFIYDITTETHTFSLNNILVHNCVAITMYPFLTDGLTKLGGISVAPTDLKSFCGEFINLVYSVSSQFMGAVATPEFLMYMDYFIRKDYGDNYLDRIDEVVENNRKARTLEKVIENCFQQVVHSMNMPAGNRGYQTVFWNISYFDKPYFEGVFGEFVFPDGTKPVWETLSWLQKKFALWFLSEREKYILTFPVETMALLTDGKDDYIDKEYADFTAELWSKGHSFFCYLSDSPDSLSSCCRLRSSLKDLKDDEEHNHTTHQFSMGTASVATGSKCVMTIDLNRAIQDATFKYYEDHNIPYTRGEKLVPGVNREEVYQYISGYLDELTERVHKYLSSFNAIIKDFYQSNMLTVYSAGFIDMRKQFLTVGVNGLTDSAEFLGLTASPNPEYQEFVNMILETINIANKRDKTRDCMFNTEFIPGENVSYKHYEWDKADGYYVSPDRIMYSSYFYNPEDDSLSVLDKFRLHGRDYVRFLDGGVALHMNLQEYLSKDQYRQLLKVAAKEGTSYFTFNIRQTCCEDCGHIDKHTLDKCPVCGSKNITYLTRIIGYLKKVSSFSEPRQIEESARFYAGGKLDD